MKNVTSLNYNHFGIYIHHVASYKLSIIFDQYYITHSQFILQFGNSFFSFYIKNSSFQSGLSDLYIFHIILNAKLNPKKCPFPHIQLISTLVIEDSQFRDNWYGIRIAEFSCLLKKLSNYIISIMMKSCLIADNRITGLRIHGKFLASIQINITDTEFIGNKANKILNSNTTRTIMIE